jgi:tetratricopeptide (TPR) repeat protein
MAAPSLQDGLARQRSGDLAGAETIYRTILQQTPDDFMVRTLLGLTLCAGDRFETGLQTIRDAIAIADDPFSHYSLGQALAGRERMAEAAEAFRRSIELQPGVAASHTALGRALAAGGDHAGAAAALKTALALDPEDPEAYVCTGQLLHQLGRPQDALPPLNTALDLAPDRSDAWVALARAQLVLGHIDAAAAAACQAVALDPASAATQLQLGDVRHRQRDPAAAAACYRRAIECAPSWAEAHSHLSNALYDQGRFQDAADAAATAIALRPDHTEAHSNRGNALLALLRTEEAEAEYRIALLLQPNSASFLSNLGHALTDQLRLDEALEVQRKALAIDPDFVDAQYNHAMTLLLAGQLEPGWRYYESRWKQPWNQPRPFAQPRWQGEPLAGRTLLLHAEQGLGDTLQMARYVALLAAFLGPAGDKPAGRVVLEVHPPLVRLLQGLPNVSQVLPLGAKLPPFDLHCPMFSLPLIFGTRLDTIPAEPYLRADPALSAPCLLTRCRALFGSGMRVGLVWQGAGQIGAHVNQERSIAVDQLAPLAGLPGVELYALQKDPEPEAARRAAVLGIVDLMEGVEDFADTAALVAELDLVISVDTSTAHLAAAMGKPVWLLSRYNGCWRWLTLRADSPWYPGLVLYRQDESRDWNGVMARVAWDLAHAAATRPVLSPSFL